MRLLQRALAPELTPERPQPPQQQQRLLHERLTLGHPGTRRATRVGPTQRIIPDRIEQA
ncbi:hypothetical protein GCM10020001_013690 [Nonomuraea salmonea]